MSDCNCKPRAGAHEWWCMSDWEYERVHCHRCDRIAPRFTVHHNECFECRQGPREAKQVPPPLAPLMKRQAFEGDGE